MRNKKITLEAIISGGLRVTVSVEHPNFLNYNEGETFEAHVGDFVEGLNETLSGIRTPLYFVETLVPAEED